MTNTPFLIRPGNVIRRKRTPVRGVCGSYSLLYLVIAVQGKWMVRVKRLDRHAPKDPYTSLGMPYLWGGRIVRQDMELPPQLEWDPRVNSRYRWAKEYNLQYARELEQLYG